jgi:hypothetical protein
MAGGGIDAPATRPATVLVAFWLVLAGAALLLLMLVLSFAAGWDTLEQFARESLAEDGRPQTDAAVHGVAQLTALVYTGILIILISVYVLFAALMLGGRNWARVTLTVLLAIGLFLAVIIAVLTAVRWSAAYLTLLATALAASCVGTIVAMFRGSAGPYFDYRARMRS